MNNYNPQDNELVQLLNKIPETARNVYNNGMNLHNFVENIPEQPWESAKTAASTAYDVGESAISGLAGLSQEAIQRILQQLGIGQGGGR